MPAVREGSWLLQVTQPVRDVNINLSNSGSSFSVDLSTENENIPIYLRLTLFHVDKYNWNSRFTR